MPLQVIYADAVLTPNIQRQSFRLLGNWKDSRKREEVNMASEEKKRILELMDNLRADKYPLEEYNHIGKRGVRRFDGYEKASGKATYTMDVQLPGMLYMRFFTSPYPHAEIKSMDTSRAESL